MYKQRDRVMRYTGRDAGKAERHEGDIQAERQVRRYTGRETGQRDN